MKKISYIIKNSFLLMMLSLFCYSCSSDDDVLEPDVEPEVELSERFTEVSGTTLEFTKNLEIGTGKNDVVLEKESDILLTGIGHKLVKTLDCYGLAAVAYNDKNEVDTTKHIEKVTLINRGTITVHTKDLVERYKDLVNTPDDQERPYYYLRVLVMYAGENCTVINKGVINVYFDHDPTNTSTIYTIALTAHNGSSIINEGEIHFYGTGSENTRFRSVATEGNYVTAMNNGLMTSEVEMCDDQRMITTGGKYNNIINNGVMRLHGPGEICGLSSGVNNVINNNLIDITHVDLPTTYFEAEQPSGIVGGIFCSLAQAENNIPSVVNRGTINMKAITSSITPEASNVAGMFFDNGVGATAYVTNEGTITVSQEGPTKINTSEAFFRSRGKKSIKVSVGYWNTTLRDFSAQPLFSGNFADFDFSKVSLGLNKEENYVDGTFYSIAPELLFKQIGKCSNSGYENMTVSSKDNNILLNWDKDNQKVSLSSK